MADFVNMNRNFIPKERREFEKLSTEELIQKMKEDCSKLQMNGILEDEDDIVENPDPEDMWARSIHEHYANILYTYSYIINNDLSWITMHGENFTADEVYGITPSDGGFPLVGIHTLENGLTIVGCMDGGDWEWPFFFFLYYDGNNVRAYIPSYGNRLNLDTKTVFGSEEEGLSDKEIEKLYNINSDDDEIDYTLKYLEKQGITDDDYLCINWNAIKEEILEVFK